MTTKTGKDKDLLARAWQAAMLNHAEIIIRALLREKIISGKFLDDGTLYLSLTPTGDKWFDRAEEWLREMEEGQKEKEQ